ncbi:MAG: FMN-binding glutamate synthase family protein [Gammaproteobacteria bacterium]
MVTREAIPRFNRKKAFVIGSLLLTAAIAVAAFYWRPMLYAFIVLGPILLLAAHDLFQQRHTLLRNYPVLGHGRYILEDFRHHIRQYFIQSELDPEPFNRQQRSLVYARAKGETDVHPFGTILNVYATGHEWINHSLEPLEPAADEPRVRIGGPRCSRPYSSSRLNISAMSYGSISNNAVLALNGGAKLGGFAHDTGEGGLSRFHLAPGGDLIWEIGTAYFGCRDAAGGFDAEAFARKATLDNVRMIEIKLSQGAKPGGGGILPAAKVSREIAEARGVPVNRDVRSPPRFSTFSTPRGLVRWIEELRDLCGGKPVGIKLCIGVRSQFMAICKAMLEVGTAPDFIVVDGAEGGTGAAELELSDSVGTPLRDALIFAHNTLVGAGLRDDIRLVASGKIISGFDIAAAIAIGADLCNSARGMMFALGCIQARECHRNTCPTGITTQDPWRVNGLVVADKIPRVANYHRKTIQHFLKVLAVAGLEGPGELGPERLMRRVTPTEVSSYRDLYDYLEPRALLEDRAPRPYAQPWAEADADRF